MRSSLRFLQSFIGVGIITAIGACSTFGGGAERSSPELAGDAGRMARLEASIDAQAREVERIAADQDEMSHQLAGLDRAVRDIRAELKQIEGDASAGASEPDVSKIKDRLAGLERQVARVSTEVSALDNSVATLEAANDRTPRMAEPDSSESPAKPLNNAEPEADPEAFALHLASYRDADSLQSGWVAFQNRYAEFLGSLKPRVAILDLDDFGGRFYRLIAGPISSRQEAIDFCDRLHANDGYCEVTRFSGEELTEVTD